MVLKRTNDCVVEGFSPSAGLRFLYSDVTETVRRLSVSHGLSLGAEQSFAKLVAGSALLFADVHDAEERIWVDVDFAGPLAGFHAEMDGDGHLVGSVFEPVPERFADAPFTEATKDEAICGSSAQVKVSRGKSTEELRSQVSFHARPATPAIVVEGFFAAVGRSVRVALSAVDCEGEVDRARALLLQRLPRSNGKAFRRVSRLFADGTVADVLPFDASPMTFRDIFNLPDLMTGPTRAVAFGCSCSREAVLAAYASEPRAVLEGWLRAGTPPTFRCHLCGRSQELELKDLERLVREKE